MPLELVAVIGLMLVAAAFCLWIGLRPLGDDLKLIFDGGEFGRAIGSVILSVLLVFIGLGGACVYLAWRLALADKVGRGLSYALLGCTGVAIAITGTSSASLTWTMVLSFVALAVLALAPNVQRFFAAGPDSALPVPVTVACTLLQVWSGLAGIVGLCLLPTGDLSARLVVVGVVMLGLGGLSFWCAREVARGSNTARLLTTAGAVLYGILSLVGDRNEIGIIVPLLIIVVIVGCLWLPSSAQAYFASHRPAASAYNPYLSADANRGDGPQW